MEKGKLSNRSPCSTRHARNPNQVPPLANRKHPPTPHKMSTVTLVKKQADFILRTPLLRQLLVPTAKAFTYFSGYRQMGLKLDDLLQEENPAMQKAISRLPAEESYARNYRNITAHQLAVSVEVLPESKAIKASEDTPYLTPYVLEAEAELAEKEALNNSVLVK